MRAFDLALTVLLFAGTTTAQEHVSFPTPDGYRLHADLYGKGERGAVLVHGGRFNKESWEKQAQILAKAGFRAMAIDFRGYGQSQPGKQTTDERHYPDVLTAVRYLRARGVKSISVVGGSMGGDAAADALIEARPGEIERTVFLASEGGDAPERLQGRKLYILARDDEGDEGPRLPRISEQYAKAPKPKKLVILEGSAHAQFIFDSDQGSRLMQELLQFLSEP
jgi:pimeloyl-ACP methyl ester carboxylesterase